MRSGERDSLLLPLDIGRETIGHIHPLRGKRLHVLQS